ncbi:trypsin-like serine protease [Ramicandelaber brevisporus]|nr:trypsin-like serine protease [Ramicandelaber brevisporus]
MKLSTTTTTTAVAAAVVVAVAFLGTAAADNYVNITPRFFGSGDAGTSEFPFMASIITSVTDENGKSTQNLCGGAIIGNRHIITNARCLYNLNPNKIDPLENIQVSCGGNSVLSPILFKVKSARTASGNLEPKSFANDMAVLEIDGSFTWNTNVAPVQFTSATLTDAQNVVVASWGAKTLNSELKTTSFLQKATVQIASDEICKAKSKGVASYKDRNYMTVCTSANGGAGSCRADFGSVLLLKEAKNYTLIGMNSFSFSAQSKPCGVEEQFDYWSRPAYYKDFIGEVTGINTLMAPVGDADPPKNETAGSGGLSTGAIVGIAVGSAVVVLIIAGFVWWKMRSTRRKAADAQKRADDAEFVAAHAVHLAHENAQVAAVAAAAANAATSGYPVIYVDPSQPEYKTSLADVTGVTAASPNVYYTNGGYISPDYAQLPITSVSEFPGYISEGAASGYFTTTGQVHPGILQTAQFYGTAGASEQPGIAVATGVAGAPNLLPPQLTTDLAHEQDSLLPTPSTPVPPNASTHPATSPQ